MKRKATSEKRSASIGLKVLQSLKQALEKAAEDDTRTVASLCEKILTEHLRATGYLKKRRPWVAGAAAARQRMAGSSGGPAN